MLARTAYPAAKPIASRVIATMTPSWTIEIPIVCRAPSPRQGGRSRPEGGRLFCQHPPQLRRLDDGVHRPADGADFDYVPRRAQEGERGRHRGLAIVIGLQFQMPALGIKHVP